MASPRGGRRARRRLDKDVAVVREEREKDKEFGNGEEEGGVKVRRKRQCKAKKAAIEGELREDLSLVPYVPPAKNTQNGELNSRFKSSLVFFSCMPMNCLTK